MASHSRETRLHTVVETAVDGLILIDEQGKIRMFNPACERLFGYSAGEVLGQNVKLLLAQPLHEELRGNPDTRWTGKSKIIGIGQEVDGRRKDGTTFPLGLFIAEARPDEGAVFVGIIHDLTERRRAEQAMREMTSRLKLVVDAALDGIILIDVAGKVLMFNPACERLFGYGAGEVIGQNVKLVMPSPFHEGHDGFLENYRHTGERKIIGIGREVAGRRKDGTTFPLELSVGETHQEGQSAFVAIIHDVTERKRMETQLVQAQKMESVGQLSGGIAHDFNNLLTVIIGNADALSEKLRARPNLRLLCDAITNAGYRGAELTRRLLLFGRRKTLQPVSVDCNRLVEEMGNLLRRTLRQDIEIRTSCEPGLAPAFADPAQTESAILNLALNAQDAMPTGGTLTIATANSHFDERYRDDHPEVLPGDYILISVADEGKGMLPEVRERAFEPYFSTKEAGKGSGLGLSMVYGFVRQSGGQVTINSEPSLGTTVRLYLPVSTTEEKPAEPMQESKPEVAARFAAILVVEDDPFVRAYAVALLETLGYRVLVATDGRDALVKLGEDRTIDLLFSDVIMPGGISGWELAERAQKLRPGLRVLLTSGYSPETLVPRTPLSSHFTILNKPYRKSDLALRLKEVWESDASG
jgi:PAS domain S-box-containing protein